MNQNLTSTSALLRIYRREKGLSSISWGRSHLQTPSTYLFNQSYFNQTQLHRGGKDSSNSYASIRERRIGLTRISHNVSGLTYAFSFIYYAFELKGESESMKKKYPRQHCKAESKFTALKSFNTWRGCCHFVDNLLLVFSLIYSLKQLETL